MVQKACTIPDVSDRIPGCGSSLAQRWGFVLRELRQCLRDRRHIPGKTAPASTAALEGTDAQNRDAVGREQR